MLLVFSFSAYMRQSLPELLLSMARNHRHRCRSYCCCWREPHPHSVVVGSERAPCLPTCNRHTATCIQLPLQPVLPSQLLPCCGLAADLHTKQAFVRPLRQQIVGGDCLFCSPAAVEPRRQSQPGLGYANVANVADHFDIVR